MKWLTTAFLCMLATISFAQETEDNPMGVQQFPMFINCFPGSAEDFLGERYGELPFLNGLASIVIPGDRSINGVMTFYLATDGKTFTIMFQPSPELSCMVISGEEIEPALSGDPT